MRGIRRKHKALHCKQLRAPACEGRRHGQGRTCLSVPLRLPMAEPGGQACLTTLYVSGRSTFSLALKGERCMLWRTQCQIAALAVLRRHGQKHRCCQATARATAPTLYTSVKQLLEQPGRPCVLGPAF